MLRRLLFRSNAINYVDASLEFLIKNSPKDSLFIIYGDHGANEFDLDDIPLIIYSKNNEIESNVEKINMFEMIKKINSIFN